MSFLFYKNANLDAIVSTRHSKQQAALVLTGT